MISSIVQEDVERIAKDIGPGVHRLSGRQMLLTGGTGFVGSYLLRTLARLNDQMIERPCHVHVVTRSRQEALARFPDLADRPDLVWLEGDIRFIRLPDVPWDFILHAAAAADARFFASQPLDTADTIVEGTKRVLEAARNRPIQAMLFVSSGAVLGAQPPGVAWLGENHPGGPDLTTARSSYAEAKRYAEVLCRIFLETYGTPVSTGRLFALVGPYQDRNSTSAVLDFIRQALRGDTIRIRDDGRAIRSYCYVADAVVALWKILLRRPAGGVFNIGSDLEAVSFMDLAERVGRLVGKPVKVIVEGSPATGILGSARYAPDVTRLHRDEGFRPSTSLDEALRRTIAWMREQGGESS